MEVPVTDQQRLHSSFLSLGLTVWRDKSYHVVKQNQPKVQTKSVKEECLINLPKKKDQELGIQEKEKLREKCVNENVNSHASKTNLKG